MTGEQARSVAVPEGPRGGEGDLGPLTDEDLLERFLTPGDEAAEAAFRALVVRHGPMVLGVCRQILQQHQDAEDAFQATFLVLARKGSTVRDPRVLGRWLYEVAYRIAVRSKAQAVRRRAHERQGPEMSAPPPEHEVAWNEMRPVLHDEVNRLPEKYRTPVVLCYLEGKTNEEVAQALGWPVGTVKGRLSRARDLLRSRLARRGLALSAALLVARLSEGAAVAEEVPEHLIDATVRSGMLVASGGGLGAAAISGRVATLMGHAGRAAAAGRLAAAVALLLLSTALLGWSSARAGLIPDLGLILRPRPQAVTFPIPGDPDSAPAGAGGCHRAP
jgi:RNA polymerase sigma factor (sigma-70 family)